MTKFHSVTSSKDVTCLENFRLGLPMPLPVLIAPSFILRCKSIWHMKIDSISDSRKKTIIPTMLLAWETGLRNRNAHNKMYRKPVAYKENIFILVPLKYLLTCWPNPILYCLSFFGKCDFVPHRALVQRNMLHLSAKILKSLHTGLTMWEKPCKGKHVMFLKALWRASANHDSAVKHNDLCWHRITLQHAKWFRPNLLEHAPTFDVTAVLMESARWHSKCSRGKRSREEINVQVKAMEAAE